MWGVGKVDGRFGDSWVVVWGGGGGGVLGFVQGGKEGRIVTAGDDALSLVFDAEKGI